VPFLSLTGAALVLAPPPGTPLLSPVPCRDLCPDMTIATNYLQPYLTTRTFDASDCSVQEGMAPPGTNRFVEFTTGVPNKGPGDLVVGSPSADPSRFTWSACHGHWHLKEYAAYRVWTPAGYDAYMQLRLLHPFAPAKELLPMLAPELQPVAGNKQGFCVFDVQRFTVINGAVDNLLFDNHGYGCGNMGISAGWGDVYGAGTPGQWVVVTGLPPGDYVVENEVNADHFYQELDYLNNSVGKTIHLS